MTFFLKRFAIAYLLLLLVTAAFTRLIDPYDYWGGPIIDGLNRYKPSADQHLASVKLRQYTRVRPSTIVAGNSRVYVGINPESPAWPARDRPVYNFGLPGYGIAGVADSLIDTMALFRPRTIYWGIDFFDYRVSRQDWRNYERISSFRSDRRAFSVKVRERMEVLLSLTALGDSLSAIVAQRAVHPAHTTPQGFNGLGEYNDFIALEGHAALFEQRNRENLKSWLSGPKAVRWPEPGNSLAWVALEKVAAACRQRGVTLVLFTYPYHADILLAIHRTGLWPAFEDWTQMLARVGSRERIPVWFFTEMNNLTTESVPAKGDTTTRLRWFWEAGHFRATLGDRMITSMTDAPRGIGVLLTPENADAALRQIKEGLSDYQTRRRGQVARFDATFRSVASNSTASSP